MKTILILISIFYLIVGLLFYKLQEFFIFHPTKIKDDYQFRFPTHFKELFYNTPNEGLIHGLHFFANHPKGIVLYLHGNAGSLKDWGWLYKEYVPRGYDFLVIDYRTYGKSKGKLTEKNLFADVQYVYDSLKTQFKEQGIIIHGRSIGTGIATKIASENSPKAVILESPYYNLADIAQKTMPILPVSLILKFKLKSNEYIPKIKGDIYIIHGTNDGVVPFKSGEKLFKLVEDKATLLAIEGGLHNNLVQYEAYQKLLDEILKE